MSSVSVARWPVSSLILWVALLLTAACSPDPKSEHAGWPENFQEAVAASKSSGRPILANFTGSDWCAPCMAQEKEVFSTETFQKWAAQNVVLLTVDFPRKEQDPQIKKQNEQLGEKFGITGFPTIVFMDAQGDELGRFDGFERDGPEKWIERAQKVLKK